MLEMLGIRLNNEFDLELDMGIGPIFRLCVHEHEHSLPDAYHTPLDICNLPLSIAEQSLTKFELWREEMLQKVSDGEWSSYDEERLTADIVAIIARYQRLGQIAPEPLSLALDLVTDSYLMSTLFVVPEDHFTTLQNVMQKPPVAGHQYYASEVINFTIKSRIISHRYKS